ncbi:hypothetical protein [Vreelandella utahensis]|uniref:hypothetical protein n=1 Tax=Vreelandella halophila TaxID=86177 RepID=UPI0015C408DB|nr:hypothetical protein [Halomonas utahensis]
MTTKHAAFAAHKEALRKDFSNAFAKALTQMGDDAKRIDWFAGNSKQESRKAA